MLGILSVSAFVISFAVQIKNSWRPDYQQNLKAAVLFSFYLFFINALIEEFFFRLILLSLLKSLTNQPLFSVMVTALIFGFYHVPLFGWDRTQAVLATIAGFCFGCVYLFTGSFIITWFVHGFADLGFIHESIGGYIVWTKIRYRELTDD
jgi:membrane protease YdiL (CAAX protease family)